MLATPPGEVAAFEWRNGAARSVYDPDARRRGTGRSSPGRRLSAAGASARHLPLRLRPLRLGGDPRGAPTGSKRRSAVSWRSAVSTSRRTVTPTISRPDTRSPRPSTWTTSTSCRRPADRGDSWHPSSRCLTITGWRASCTDHGLRLSAIRILVEGHPSQRAWPTKTIPTASTNSRCTTCASTVLRTADRPVAGAASLRCSSTGTMANASASRARSRNSRRSASARRRSTFRAFPASPRPVRLRPRRPLPAARRGQRPRRLSGLYRSGRLCRPDHRGSRRCAPGRRQSAGHSDPGRRGPLSTSATTRSRGRTPTAKDLRIKTGILNAYYFPDGDYGSLHPDISPVNSYRVLFNKYFGAEYPILPDRVIAFSDDAHLYTFHDVTDKIRGVEP